MMRHFTSPRWIRSLQVSRMALVISVMIASFESLVPAQGKAHLVEHPTSYRTVQIDGLSIFYREAVPEQRA